MFKINFAATLAIAAVAMLGTVSGSSAQVWGDAPFCSENYSRTGLGRVCAYYTYDQCREATSGVGGSCSANAWYQPRQYDRSAPRRTRKSKHKHRH